MSPRPPALCAEARPARARQPRRILVWWLLLLAVLLAHALATLWLQHNLVSLGDGETPLQQRLEVAFVQVLAPAAPAPAPAPAARARPKPAKARAAAPAASAPPAAASEAEMFAEAASAPPSEPEPVVTAQADAPASAPESASAPAAQPPIDAAAPAASALASAASAPASAPFEWPASTRLTYLLSGNYRGEVRGNARVQWIRQGARYQVHLDVSIGPSFAPLMSRRMTSDGELGEHGLTPQRYDEATRLPFQRTRHASVVFAPESVTLANGSQHPAPAGLQDTASQFVQFTWLFTTRPELLRAGNTVTMPLALPRRVGLWVYDVIGQERLVTPVGELDTFHVRPRPDVRRPGHEMTIEIWLAPTLQYLPVRIRIQQDVDTFADLLLDALPLQAAPAGGDAPAR